MATRRLPRTIVEGGRQGFDKNERKLQIQKSRRASRDFCQTYSDEDDTELLNRKGKHYYRDFADKLKPLKKYLKAHVGQPWDVIWSKLCAMTDRRTMKGYHFLEHAHSMVFGSMGAETGTTYYGFYLENGILGFKERPSRRSNYKEENRILHLYTRWMNGRNIRLVGSKYFWFEPTKTVRYHYSGEYREMAYGWRQGKPLDKKEVGHMEWLYNFSQYVWKKVVNGA